MNRPHGALVVQRSARKSGWDNWFAIRGHFAEYGADKDSIAWLQVAERARAPFPPEVGHLKGQRNKDNYTEHVLGVLRDYIAWLKEWLKTMDTDRRADRLTYWKTRYNIA